MDVQWGFFVSIHLALLGGVFFIDRPVPVHGKLAATAVYVVFATFNFRALRAQHRILEHVYQDIVELKDSACCQGSELMAFYVNEVAADFDQRMMIVAWLMHLVAFGVFVLSVFAIRFRLQGDKQ
jgi:hypothetical protein